MIDWNDLITYHLSVVNDKIQRKKEVQENYINNNTKYQKIDFIKQMLLMNDYYISLNDYPYNLCDNIEHYLFWYKNVFSFEDALQISFDYFKKSDNEIIIFVNSEKNKSVPEINHYHLFIKKTN
jgi:hypothetical protein